MIPLMGMFFSHNESPGLTILLLVGLALAIFACVVIFTSTGYPQTYGGISTY